MTSYPIAAIAAHTAIRDGLDAEGATAYVEIYDSSDTLLATLPLDYPCGSVDGGTGQVTISWGPRDDAAAAGGTADYGLIKDAAGAPWFELPCVESATPVADSIAMSSLTIVLGAPVEGGTFTIG